MISLKKLFTPNQSHWKKSKYPIGIVAGQGLLPERVNYSIQQSGHSTAVVAVDRAESDPLKSIAQNYSAVTLAEGKKALEWVKEQKIEYLVLAGKIMKQKMYGDDFQPDEVIQDTLQNAGSGQGDDKILKSLAALLKLNGIDVLSLADILTQDVTPKGVLNQKKLSQEEERDIQMGFKMAKSIGKLDIGQCVVVKNGTVVAVEAIEGTDVAIQRVADTGIKGGVVVKVAKPQQDIRFDMPIIGMNTIKSAVQSHCSVIACEANKSLILDQAKVIEYANQNDISVVGISS